MSDAEQLGPEFSETESASLNQLKERVKSGEVGGESDASKSPEKTIGKDEKDVLSRIEQGGDDEQILKDLAAGRNESVNKGTDSEKKAEFKEKTPAELREERRMAIVKELETEWETKNGPMDRPLSEREISKNKEMARLLGKEWDGRTTQMTEAANEFFFDHKGKGKNSVPRQAERILVERFPEYAQAAAYQENHPEIKAVSTTQEEKQSSGVAVAESTEVETAADINPVNENTVQTASVSTEQNEQQLLQEALKDPRFWTNLQSLVEAYSQNNAAFDTEYKKIEKENPSLARALLSLFFELAKHLTDNQKNS